jgi:hypothetical protein
MNKVSFSPVVHGKFFPSFFCLFLPFLLFFRFSAFPLLFFIFYFLFIFVCCLAAIAHVRDAAEGLEDLAGGLAKLLRKAILRDRFPLQAVVVAPLEVKVLERLALRKHTFHLPARHAPAPEKNDKE